MECFANPSHTIHQPNLCYFCLTKTLHVHKICLLFLLDRMKHDLRSIGIKPANCSFIFMQFLSLWFEFHKDLGRSAPILYDLYQPWWDNFKRTYISNRRPVAANQIMLVIVPVTGP